MHLHGSVTPRLASMIRDWRHASRMPDRAIQIDVAIDSDEDVRLLRGALLSAKATELAELQRWDSRLSFGYGTDSAREGMSAEVEQRRRRIELLDRLIEGLAVADGSTER